MYYPKSQITPNLYTNGDEFIYADNKQQYIGFYFALSTGKYFTGRNQDDRPNQELITISLENNTSINNSITPNNFTINTPYSIISIDYDIITQNRYQNKTITPTYNPELPTDQDYQNGEFRRLFCKKSNELQYIEINEETYTKLLAKDPQILWQLYIPFNISWQLTGDKQQVAKTNKNIVELTSKRLQLFRFNEYLKLDYIKYYK